METNHLPNKRLVALALFQLGGAERAIDTEDLAVKVAESFPGHFRWKKYPDQINLDQVRKSASRLLTEENPPLVSGGVRNGWMLTPAGLEWCSRTLGKATGADADWKALLYTSEAYTKFEQNRGDEITIHDLRRFLRVDEYTSARRHKERAQAVVNAAAGDARIQALVDYLRQRFPEEWS